MQRRKYCLMCCRSTEVMKNGSKRFPSHRRVTRRQLMRHFTSNGSDQCQNGSSNPPYSISRVTPIHKNCCHLPTASAHSNKIGQITLQSVLIIKPEFITATSRRAENKSCGTGTEVHGGESLELVKLTREPASSRPNPCTFLKNTCLFAAPFWLS